MSTTINTNLNSTTENTSVTLGHTLVEKRKIDFTKYIPEKSTRKEFDQIQSKISKPVGWAAGISIAGIAAGTFKFGSEFPSKALEVVGDAFGSIAAVISPVFIVMDQVINTKVLRNENPEINDKLKKRFDIWREGFYRIASIGFAPFIVAQYAKAKNFTGSLKDKVTFGLSVPNLFFSFYAWTCGNFKSLIAWGAKTKKLSEAERHELDGNKEKEKEALQEASDLDDIYQSNKRLAVIGSITNTVAPGIRQASDVIDLFTGESSLGEFFERPALGISRLISFGTAVPELFAKNVDAAVRLVKEKDRLQLALPKQLHKPIDKLSNWLEPKLGKDVNEKSAFREVRHVAEALFHTISPLSMFALFLPLLDREHLDEDAQGNGGAQALIDKTIGRVGKTWLFGFAGIYTFFARLPQAVFQIGYFGRGLIGWTKGEGTHDTSQAQKRIKESILDSGLVRGISSWAQNTIKRLVPDYYYVEHEHGFRSYEQIQAADGVAQAKESERFANLKEFCRQKSHDGSLEEYRAEVEEEISSIVNDVSIEYVNKDATQGKHKLTEDETSQIRGIAESKLKINVGLESEQPRKTRVAFPGAEFLASWIFKLFDFENRLSKIDYTSDHHNMTTAYANDEVAISFEHELWSVLGECIVGGLRNTVNRSFNVARQLGMAA